jgi:uridine kinase
VVDLIVLTGPPGAGKSTVARVLAARFAASALVPGDDFFAFLVRGAVLPWLPEAHA